MESFLKNLKLKLQFTGWLQYLLPITIATLALVIAGLLSLFGLLALTYVFLGISGFLFTITLFDITTIKFNIRPKEKLPKRRDNMDVFDLMRARRACRSFQNRKLTSSDKSELLSVVQEINDRVNSKFRHNPIRFEYINAPLTVWPVVGAQEFLVAIASRTYNRQSIIDVGRNLQKVVHHATKMGLATCWIGPGADHKSLVQHLGNRFDLREDHIVCVCAIGYKSRFIPFALRIGSKIQHKRLPLSSLFFADSEFKNPLDEKANPFNQFGRCYEVCQWAPSSFNEQTTRCTAITDATIEFHLNRFDFYATTKSRFYAPIALGIWCANWELGCESLGVKGHFEILSEKERYLSVDSIIPEFPLYDVSWILEKMI